MVLSKKMDRPPLVLFYTNTPRAFRTTLIGYLYEIAQEYNVILLSEELDQETTRCINSKNIFPNILKIIAIHQYSGPKMGMVGKHRYLCNIAKRVIEEYKPEIVVSSSDWHSMFEMYLMRFAAKTDALRLTLQDTFNIAKMKDISTRMTLMGVYSRTPSWLPYWFRYVLIQARKYSGYLLYHFILPIMAGQKPFFTFYSYALLRGCSGCGETDYHVVLSQRDFLLHKYNGVPVSKLHMLRHPIMRGAKGLISELFKSTAICNNRNYPKSIVAMLPAEDIGIRRNDYGLISSEERYVMHKKLLSIVLSALPNYHIYIKPHPLINDIQLKRKIYEGISNRISVVDPSEPADIYIEKCEIIMELPRAASTTLFTATLQCPDKLILALDTQADFLGDCYKDFEGVEYLTDIESLKVTLKKFSNGTYVKPSLEEANIRDQFPGTLNDLLGVIYKRKRLAAYGR